MTKKEKMSLAFDMRALGYGYEAIADYFQTLGEHMSVFYAKKLVTEQIKKEMM